MHFVIFPGRIPIFLNHCYALIIIIFFFSYLTLAYLYFCVFCLGWLVIMYLFVCSTFWGVLFVVYLLFVLISLRITY
jgi:hypothetical protein